MCIICAKKKGVDTPTREMLEAMYGFNPDGAGYMYAQDGNVYIVKGFMSFDKLYKSLENLYKKIDAKNTGIVYHFRITTSGDTSPTNCHPFPVSGDVKDLQKLNLTTDLGVAHNGIIDITPRKGISDTMTYIMKELSETRRVFPEFYKDEKMLDVIESRITSKMCFLESNGDIDIVGDFIEDEGLLFSNGHYKNNYYYDYGVYGSYGYYDSYYDGVFTDKAIYNRKDLTIIGDSEVNTISGTTLEIEIDEWFMIDKENHIYIYDTKWNDAYDTGEINALSYAELGINEDDFEVINVLKA